MDERELEQILTEADQALDEGRAEEALALALEAVSVAPDDPEAHFIEAEALLELGEYEAAIAAYRKTDALAPDEAAVLLGLGLSLFEVVQLEEAEQHLKRALDLDADLAEAHEALGLIFERRRQESAALRHFQRARAIDPESFPAPVEMSQRDFEAAIRDALEELPPEVARVLANVNVSIEDVPLEDDLLATSPPLSPRILGLWRGTPLTEDSVLNPGVELPGGIVLFRKNLSRFASDRHDLVEQIRVTVLHEIGHVLGLDEDDLVDRGLD